MKTRIGMILAVLFLSIAPVFAADPPKGCDMKDKAKACCKKDAECCKDPAKCDKKDHACKHAEGEEHSCAKSCAKKS
ncbi:MAG TPA: hypothetical protein VG323_01535 [Thermoanaerobaculia bacterium]|nr:hypothetical protein [Thermoanaerobaculia bacterium]